MSKQSVLHRLGTTVLQMAVLATASMPAAAGPPGMDAVAGVYHTHSRQLRTNGTEYTAENILEIVKLTPATAYFRTRVTGSNGHECNLSGVASLDLADLIYRPARPFLDSGALCRLSIRMEDGRLLLDDRDEGCQSACGVRASFGDGIFPLSARRPIHYLPRLLQSTEFKQAVAEYRAQPAVDAP